MIRQDDIDRIRVKPGKKVRLKDFDTAFRKDARPDAEAKARTADALSEDLIALAKAQELLYADDRHALLVIFQALDAAGKDGTIKHVMSGVNPQGCQVFSFKQPSAEELDHNFLWRCMKSLPERGRIGIFNRSYYEEVLVVKVHPEWLERQRLPDGKRNKEFWEDRYDDINRFERHLTRNGTTIVKIFLHVSKDEQKKRFLERLDKPEKNWKFSPADVRERANWSAYQEAYEQCLEATSTECAPWYVIPADQKWATRAIVAELLATTIQNLDLKFPQPTATEMSELAEARRLLESE